MLTGEQIQSQLPRKYNGRFQRRDRSWDACNRNGHTFDQRRRSGTVSPYTNKVHDLITESLQDATLKRCFGKDEKIIDCDWDYISQQRTIKTPHEQMPRLQDLLEYLSSPGLEYIWLLLDIKVSSSFNPENKSLGKF